MDIIGSALTLGGAAGIVATVVENTDWLFDGIKDPIRSNRVKRIWVFLIALTLVSVEVYRRLGYHSNGDLLGLLTLAGTVAGLAITGWSLFNGRLGTQATVTTLGAAIESPPVRWLTSGEAIKQNAEQIGAPITPLNSVTPPTGTPPS